MPEYRLVFSNGKRSVRHVDVEASDLVSAARSFSPPEGWSLQTVRRTYGLSRSDLSPPQWANVVFLLAPIFISVVAAIQSPWLSAPFSQTNLMVFAIAGIFALVGLPLLWRNAKAVRADAPQTHADHSAEDWRIERGKVGLGALYVVGQLTLVGWALLIVFGQLGAGQAMFAGVLLGFMAGTSGLRLSEGPRGADRTDVAPALA